MIEAYKIVHVMYDTAVAPGLMMSKVSHTGGNMHCEIMLSHNIKPDKKNSK